MDNIEFQVARSGKFGPAMEETARRVEGECLPRWPKSKHKRYMFGVLSVFLVLLSMVCFIVYSQVSNNKWVTPKLRVQFEDSKRSQYSGCYYMEKGNISNKWYVYKSLQEFELGKFCGN